MVSYYIIFNSLVGFQKLRIELEEARKQLAIARNSKKKNEVNTALMLVSNFCLNVIKMNIQYLLKNKSIRGFVKLLCQKHFD